MQLKFRSVLALALVVGAASPAAARADSVTTWNGYANAAIFATVNAAHPAIVRTAMVQGAVYDAVNAIAGGYQPYLLTDSAEPMFPTGDQIDAAVATAAFRVASAVAPSQLATLQLRYAAYMATIPDSPAEASGIEVGGRAAAAMLGAHGDAVTPGSFPVVVGTQPGQWRPSPPAFGSEPAPWVAYLTPFLVPPDGEMLRTDGPNALTSEAYAEDFNEVKSLGALNSTTRTPDETRAAIFWQSQPGGLYGGLMGSLSQRFGLSTPQTARLYAMTSLAAGDAAIGCWNDKARWNFWRPIDAIHLADTDGNPATEADPSWKPLFDPSTPTTGPPLSTPPFPDHPSGHSCTSSATLHALQEFFGTDKIDGGFDIVSSRFPGQPRHFDRFSEVLKEVIDARVWGGIHFRTADVQGAVLGKKVAHWERKHYFQPTG